MKFSRSPLPVPGVRLPAAGGTCSGPCAAFTLIEIAISMAIVGFALLAIIKVLPFGMTAQRDNREETIINQDATVLLEAIRAGAGGADYLTNYIYAITNYMTEYDINGAVVTSHEAGYTYNAAAFDGSATGQYITNGMRIIGLLSTPQFTEGVGGVPLNETLGRAYISNRVVAYVRTISGLAAERPPQTNELMMSGALAYRLLCVNAPVPADTNYLEGSRFMRQLAGCQRELRLTFLWPQYPSGKLGDGRQTYRATLAGMMETTNYLGDTLYFFRPQIFTIAP